MIDGSSLLAMLAKASSVSEAELSILMLIVLLLKIDVGLTLDGSTTLMVAVFWLLGRRQETVFLICCMGPS